MLSHSAFVGEPGEGIYSQTLSVGDFFIVVSLPATLELGRNLLTKIEEEIVQTPATLPSDLVKLHPDVNILVAKIEDKKLRLAGAGGVKAKLIRRDRTINLFTGPAVSGELLEGDTLVLGTDQYFSSPSPEDPKVAGLEIKVESGKPLPKPTIFLRPTIPTSLVVNRRQILILSLVVLVTLVSLVFFQLRSKVLEQRQKNLAQLTQMVNDDIASAQKLSGVSNAIARDLLLQTRKNLLAKADSSQVKTLLAKLDAQIAATARVYNISAPSLYYDFSLLRAGAKVTAVGGEKDQGVFLDAENGAIYSLDFETKKAAIVAGNDLLKKGIAVGGADKNIYVVSSQGIIAGDKVLIKPSDSWGKVVDLGTFAGNIYLLDSQNNQIWKYQNTDFGFADISPYLTAGGVDFSHVLKMAIDGSIYVLTSTGNVAKFSGGGSDTFKITGLDPKLADAVSIFATDETENVYILDQKGSRVVVLTKKGNYVSSYLLPTSYGFIFASEKNKKVFLLESAKVYSFDQR